MWISSMAVAVGKVGSTARKLQIPIRVSAVSTAFELTYSLHIVWKRIRLLFCRRPRSERFPYKSWKGQFPFERREERSREASLGCSFCCAWMLCNCQGADWNQPHQ